MSLDKAKLDEERRKRNAELLERAKNGETTRSAGEESWFPKRPQIKKDPKLVAKLFDKPEESK